MRYRRRIILILSLAVIGTMRVVAGQAANPVAINRIELRELWRTGGEDTDVVLGLVGRAMTTRDGGIACLDYQQEKVLLFTRDGELAREIDLSGEGPGRVSSPSDPVRLADGRIAIARGFPASIEIFDGDWNYEESISLYNHNGNEELRLENLMAYRDGFLIVGEHINKAQADGKLVFRRHNYVRILSAMGALLNTVYTRERVLDFSNCVYVEDQAHYVQDVSIGPSGEIYVPTRRNGYEITAFAPEGTPRAVLRRDYQPLARTRQEIDYLETSYHTMLERSCERHTVEISKYERDIDGVACTAAGEVRVTTSRSYQCDDPTVFCRYDIFAAQGRFIRQDDIILPTVEDRSGRLRWLDDGRVVLITGLIDAGRGMYAASNNTQNALEGMQEELYSEPMEFVVYEVGGK